MTVLVANEKCADDVPDPRCARHWTRAVGGVVWETADDHEHRELFCPACAWDVQSEAMLSEPFAPPVLFAIGLDLHREWAV